mmetsp:Transcript_5650/g.12834  ORF Transcript_5650/g.12834 Transcript_5650/m.12834 type:complete len:337 (+) Transcript_5650:73-1083(+)
MAYLKHGRFYESEYPSVKDLVIVQVNRTDDKIGAYVTLLEYGHKEAMINIGEVSKRRIRSLAKLLRVGSTEVCMVVSVDEEKGYINLSKKQVASEDCQPKQELFAKAKAVHGTMQHVASSNGIDVDDLCAKVSWPLNDRYTTAFDAFKKHVVGEINVWEELDFSQPGLDLTDMEAKLKGDIEAVLQRRLISSSIRLQAKCEVSCYEYDGIDAVKEALAEGFKANKEEIEVSIKLVAHPLFALSCICKDKELGASTLEEAMGHIEKAILAKGGGFEMKSKPTFVVKDDDKKEGEEDSESGSSSGSSDEEEEDETMGNFNADFSDLMKKKVEGGEEED